MFARRRTVGEGLRGESYAPLALRPGSADVEALFAAGAGCVRFERPAGVCLRQRVFAGAS